jgi:hypothetical protein
MDVYTEHENFAILLVLFHYKSILLSLLSSLCPWQTCTNLLHFTCFRLATSSNLVPNFDSESSLRCK